MKQDKWYRMFEELAADAESADSAGAGGEADPAEKRNFYAADAPVMNPSLDRFMRWPFAKRVAGMISSRMDPSSTVVAIYGAWGEGKTTVLNFIERELQKSPAIVCLRFNPWRFNDEVHLLQNFFKTLADALGKSTTTYKEKIGKWVSSYAGMLTPFSVSIPFLMEFSPGEGVKKMAKSMSSVELEEIRSRIENFLREEGKRIVVLMDDIDRLDRSEIQSIFKLVKLSADFAHTAYILAFDEEMVSAALGEKYGTGNLESGRNFLEKIVQVPLYLPAADRLSLRKFFFECLDEVLRESKIRLTEEQAQAFVIHFVYGIEIRLSTPRIAKCYRNVIGFSLPILKGQVYPVDLMLVEAMRVFYPKLYDTVRDNPDVFLGSKLAAAHENSEQMVRQRSLEIINRGLTGLTADEAESARYLLKTLFPRLCGIFGNTYYGPEWEDKWTRERRICSEECFSRFFSYTVSPDDVTDPELAAFIKSVAGKAPDAMASDVERFVARKSPEKMVLKLMRNEKKFPPADASNLAVALARLGRLFPRPETMFSFTTAFSQAGILIGQFVRSVAFVRDRFALAKTIISECDPLPFALECFKWLRTTDEKGEALRIFSIEDEGELARTMVARIRDAAARTVIYSDHPEDAVHLLEFWAHWGSRDETDAYIRSTFAENPANAFSFLTSFLGTAFDVKLNINRREEFGDEQYADMSRVADPETVFEALGRIYGEKLEAGPPLDSPRDLVAGQFIRTRARNMAAAARNTEDAR